MGRTNRKAKAVVMKYLVLIAVALAAVAEAGAPKMKPAAGFEMPTSGKFKDALKRRAIKTGVESLMEARDAGVDIDVPHKMFSPAQRVMKNRPGVAAPVTAKGADLSKFKGVFNKDLQGMDMMAKLRETKETVAKAAAEKSK